MNDMVDRYGPAVRTMFAQKGYVLSDDELRDLFDPKTPTPDLDDQYRDMLYPGLNQAMREQEARPVAIRVGRWMFALGVLVGFLAGWWLT